MNKRRQKRLVDCLMDAYVSWREACLRVSDSYGSWINETGMRATLAFGSYMAALDQEEDAAEAYARLVRSTSQDLSREPDPAHAVGRPTPEVGRR